ncbi:MAG: urease [Campylobacteraceae bacterium]|jgi:urease accessory protein|nr:urease [Campylobacteraceae bacterium]
MRTKALLKLIQILDASFPSGVFAHSFGLEPHVALNFVKNADELRVFLENIIKYQHAKMEFPTILKVYKYAEKGSLDLILKLDEKFSSMYSHAFAKAYKTIGENYFAHLKYLKHSKQITKLYFEQAKNTNEIVLLSLLSYDLGLHEEDFMLFWSKKNLINIAATSLKISKIKPSEVQQILFGIDNVLKCKIKNTNTFLSNFNPLFDAVIFEHKNIEPRLFMT